MSMDLLNVNKSRYLSSIFFFQEFYILAADSLYLGCCGCGLCAVLERRHYYLDLCRQQTTEPLNTGEPSTWQIRAWWKFKRFQIFEQNLKLSKLRLLPHFMIRRTRKIGSKRFVWQKTIPNWMRLLFRTSRKFFTMIALLIYLVTLMKKLWRKF